jgi:hypothetical protein
MDKPTTPTKKVRRAVIVVDGSETAVAITDLFDRTAKCLALCNEFSQAIAAETDQGRNGKAITEISLRFATGLVSTYRGAVQMVADQTLFKDLEIDSKAVN